MSTLCQGNELSCSLAKVRDAPWAIRLLCQQVADLSFKRALVRLGLRLELVNDLISRLRMVTLPMAALLLFLLAVR